MSLPVSQVGRKEITLPSGAKVEIRGLSRAEALQARAKLPDVAAMECVAIAAACGVTFEEAVEWQKTARADDGEYLTDEIAELSGLSEAEGKADAEG